MKTSLDGKNSGISEIKNIWSKIKRRDFSGNSGQAVKNSIYQFSTNFATKIGSLIFTIIMARLLMPELFGLYNLALSTILIFVSFSDLGIGESIIRFVSRELGRKNPKKVNHYLKYLIKFKSFFVILVSLALIILSPFISSYYDKPIFLALLAGGLYILFVGFVALTQSIFQAHNLFKPIFLRESIFQTIRIILIPLLIILFLKNAKTELILFWIIFALAITYLISGISLFFSKGVDFHSVIISRKVLPYTKKREIKKFVLFMSATALSGISFGYIDILILGKFVSSEYLAFYNVAFSIIGAIIPLLSFSVALLPIFSRLTKEKLNTFFEKSIKISLIFSFLSLAFIIIFSPFIVKLLFGEEYILSSNILRIFSLLLILIPIANVYSTYFTATGKPWIVTKIFFITFFINLILDFVLILSLISYGPIYAIYGSVIATIVTRLLGISLLILYKRRAK